MNKDFKFKVITEASTNGVSKTCEKYDISRTLYYRWLNRYKANGIDGLSSSKKDFIPTNKINNEIETALLNLIKQYPTYGPKAIKYLFDDLGYKISESAIYNIMKRNSLSKKEERLKFSRKQQTEVATALPNLNQILSGECWLFWITDYGSYNHLGHIYEYTLFDYKSRIACSRLYNKITFSNFEDILTSTAMPVAKTLNLKISYLCFFQSCKIMNISTKTFNYKINKILDDNGFDFKIHTFMDKSEDLNIVNNLKEQFTEKTSAFLVPLINKGITFLELKLKFQDYIRNYNIADKNIFDIGEYTPIEYHNKLSNTKLILPIWAYIKREY